MADTSSSSSVRVKPDGTSEFIFPGGVEMPIKLDEGASGANSITWITDPGEFPIARIRGYQSTAPGSPGITTSGMEISTGEQGSDAQAGFRVIHDPFSFAHTRVEAFAQSDSGSAELLILNALGDSSFVQGPSVRMSHGSGYIDFDGSGAGATTTIEHGLGVAPESMQMTGRVSTAEDADLFFYVTAIGAQAWDHVTVTWAAQIFEIEPIEGRYAFTWLAIA